MQYETAHERLNESHADDSRLNESNAGISRPRRKPTVDDYEFVLNENSKFQTSELGKGSYGVVKKVKDKRSGEIFAMKIMNKKGIFEYSNKDNLKREINIQKAIEHPHIVKLHKYFEDQDNVYLVLEFAENGSLFHYIRKKKKFTENEAFVYFFQTCLGIDYLHKRDIIHRDLKPENLLLTDNGDVKICDFGWSADIATQRHTFCGTVDYMAPEMIKNQPHDHRLDIWSLGVLLFEMLHGYAPFKGRSDQEKTRNISMNAGINFDPALSNEVVDLIRRILQPAPVNRISMQGIFEHPWMKKAEKIYDVDIASYVRHQDEQIREIKRAEQNKNILSHQSSLNTSVNDRSMERAIHQLNSSKTLSSGLDKYPVGNSAKIITIQDNTSPLTMHGKLSYEEPKKQSYNNNRSTKASESGSIGSGPGSNTLTIEQLLKEHGIKERDRSVGSAVTLHGIRQQEKPIEDRYHRDRSVGASVGSSLTIEQLLKEHGIKQEKPATTREDLIGHPGRRADYAKSQQFSTDYVYGLNSNTYPKRELTIQTEADKSSVYYNGSYNFGKSRRDTADGHLNRVYSLDSDPLRPNTNSPLINMYSSETRDRRQPHHAPYPGTPYDGAYRDKRIESRANSIDDKLSRSDTREYNRFQQRNYTHAGLVHDEREEYEDFKRMSRVSHRNVEIFKKHKPPKEMKELGFFEKILAGIGCITRDTGSPKKGAR